MRRVGADVAGEQVAGGDADGTTVVHDHVEHLHAVEQGHGAGVDLAGQGRVGAEQQLRAGLAPGVEGPGHLGAAERAVVEEAAVLAGEGDALGRGLVDDVDRHLGQTVHVGLAGAVVAALDGVVEETVHRVAVVAVVLRTVDAALGRDGVRPPGGVVVRNHLDVVPELAERGGGRGTGEAGPHHDDLELPSVVRVDQLQVELVLGPLVGQRAVGDLGVEGECHGCVSFAYVVSRQWTTPARTMIGNEQLTTATRTATPAANPRRTPLKRGLFSPRLWKTDQAPWNRWMATAMFAAM